MHRRRDGIYERLGVRRIINAAGPVTRLGGNRLAPEVAAAMAEAAQSHVQIDELQERASAILADATGAEAGLITSGAEAGLLLGTAACLAGFDPRRMDDLPFVHDGRNEVVVQRGHRNAYDHAIRAAGAVFVEVGYLGAPGAGCHYAWQIEAAITERTVAVACPIMDTPGTVPLPEVAEVAHTARPAGDRGRGGGAAAPREPQPLHRRGRRSGGVLGWQGDRRAAGLGAAARPARPDRVGAAPDARHGRLPRGLAGWPRLSGERAGYQARRTTASADSCKVGKEQAVGLLVALERYLAHDEAAELAAQSARVYRLAEALDGLRGVRCNLTVDPEPAASRRPRSGSTSELLGMSAFDVIEALETGDPTVFVSQGLAPRGGLVDQPDDPGGRRGADRRRPHHRGGPRRAAEPRSDVILSAAKDLTVKQGCEMLGSTWQCGHHRQRVRIVSRSKRRTANQSSPISARATPAASSNSVRNVQAG